MKRVSRGFKLSLGCNLWYTYRVGPLRQLGDSTHFLDTIFCWGDYRPSFSEMGTEL